MYARRILGAAAGIATVASIFVASPLSAFAGGAVNPSMTGAVHGNYNVSSVQCNVKGDELIASGKVGKTTYKLTLAKDGTKRRTTLTGNGETFTGVTSSVSWNGSSARFNDTLIRGTHGAVRVTGDINCGAVG